ncbi:MAG: hypothetical protein EU550_00645 [Promethearchaeota archaeon]|nr:MAG: hypothetical protein EU550_00645 [Candidatus Lokiarchaeota archaeon]
MNRFFSLMGLEQSAPQIIPSFIEGLESWCILFNEFCFQFFNYVKYLFSFVLIGVGILILLKARGIYFNLKLNKPEDDYKPLKRTRIFVGTFYIFSGLGILFNFLTYFLIILLDPLPDRFIFEFINFNGTLNSYGINRIEELNDSKYPHEVSIYYCFALGSFYGILNLFLSFLLLFHNRINIKPRRVIFWFLSSLSSCLLFGFTTSLIFFIG